MMKNRCRLLLGCLWIGLCLSHNAFAFDPSTTHPGLTMEAVLRSKLHFALKNGLNLNHGLLTQLTLHSKSMDARLFLRLRKAWETMDPTGGYRPNTRGRQTAISWILLGSVLAEIPPTQNRHPFFDPTRRGGLDNSHIILSPLVQSMALFEEQDTWRQFFTGTGFDLTGMAVTDWLKAGSHPFSLKDFFQNWTLSSQKRTPSERENYQILALLSLGHTLHLLQDMASPSHVRNDFAVGHLESLGKSVFFRGSAFEYWVSEKYHQHNLPRYYGPSISFPRALDFFSNKKWRGLADITHSRFFSPGTLPPPAMVSKSTQAKELINRINGRLIFEQPKLLTIDLACALLGNCYLNGPHGILAVYRINEENKLEFSLDARCHQATAEHLLPLAIAYSTGLIEHLFRGRLIAERKQHSIVLQLAGLRLKGGSISLLKETAQGERTLLRTVPWNPAHSASPSSNQIELPLQEHDFNSPLICALTGIDIWGESVALQTKLLP